MYHFKRKRDWITGLNDGSIPNSEVVTLWVLPNGALCKVDQIENVPTLRNGTHNAIGAKLAGLLLKVGIRGWVVINNENQIPQGMPNWLTWWLSHVPFEQQMRLLTLKITSFGQAPKEPLPFQVETILPMEVEAGLALSVVSAKSRSHAVGQFIVERKNGESYRLEPHRTVDARVIDVTPFGFILKSAQGVVFSTHQVHRTLKADLERKGLKAVDLIGSDVAVQYTMFTQGPRLNNYKSASVVRASGLDEIEDLVQMSEETLQGDPLFQAPAWAQSTGMLKLQHCLNAMITIDDDKTTITARDATDPERLLFRLVKGAVPGHFIAKLANTDGQLEEWLFEPYSSADILNPVRFVEAMESALYYATGLSIRELGLCYTDRMRQLETA